MTRLHCVILILAICPALSAEERRLHFEIFDQTYDLIFDDTRIPDTEMRQIAWLSPYLTSFYKSNAGSSPFQEMYRSIDYKPDLTYEVEKVIMAPPLESCSSPESALCKAYDPTVPDAAFLRNAAENLDRADEQVGLLLHMSLPPQLQPVRAYLLEHLLLSVDEERARYDYLKSGDVTPLRTLLCRECECGANEEALLGKLATEPDPKLRRQLSWYDWCNRLLACERQTHPPTYPLGAWERFLQDFGIAELGIK